MIKRRIILFTLGFLLVVSAMSCTFRSPEALVHIRIRNLSEFELTEVNLGHGRQNGETRAPRYGFGLRSPFDGDGYTIYKSMDPITANYRAVEIRTEEFARQTVYFTGHESLSSSNTPITREPLEAGKYYTFEFDFEPDPKHDDRFDVIYFNIVEDPPPNEP